MMVHSAASGSIPVPDMSALIARLEAAETGGAELDYLIDEAFSEWRNIGGGWAVHKVTGERVTNSFSYPAPVTTSLDAALALAERALDQRGPININVCLAGSAQAQIYPTDPCGPHVQALAPTPALALCIAISKAKEGGNHVG